MSFDHDTPDWVRELQRQADAATPGPWYVRRVDDPSFMAAYYLTNSEGGGSLDVETWDHPSTVVAITLLQDPSRAVSPQNRENAGFIASSRTAVPQLCNALVRAVRGRAALADVLRTLLARPSLLGTSKPDETVERAWRLLGELEQK